MTLAPPETDTDPSPIATTEKISCRPMRAEDIDAAVDLLVQGFPNRSAAYWSNALLRLRDRKVADRHPRFGYVMMSQGRLVGIVLLIYAESASGQTFANVSSWYVETCYRGYSSALLAYAFRQKGVTLVNVSPSASTIETIEAQGFVRYCAGSFHAIAALGSKVAGATVRVIAPDDRDAPMLAHLAAHGCRSYEIVHDGQVHAFAFLDRQFWQDRLRGAQLVYCRDIADFVRFAGPLGRQLMRHGLFSVMIDANGPIEGLKGRYLPGRRPKYYRGDVAPPLNDLRETELVLFGP